MAGTGYYSGGPHGFGNSSEIPTLRQIELQTGRRSQFTAQNCRSEKKSTGKPLQEPVKMVVTRENIGDLRREAPHMTDAFKASDSLEVVHLGVFLLGY
jgi:hypothetical protein